MKNKKYKGPERRKSVRVTYAPDRKPVLKVGENEFEVADISEMGLRFFNDRKIEFGHWVVDGRDKLSQKWSFKTEPPG